jgi:hypothetical protein
VLRARTWQKNEVCKCSLMALCGSCPEPLRWRRDIEGVVPPSELAHLRAWAVMGEGSATAATRPAASRRGGAARRRGEGRARRLRLCGHAAPEPAEKLIRLERWPQRPGSCRAGRGGSASAAWCFVEAGA